MVDMKKILDFAISKEASDVHFVQGNKPIIRVARSLIPIETCKELTNEDMMEIYNHLIKRNEDADETIKKTRRFDTSYEISGIRCRVNISFSNDLPVATFRIIKNILPSYEELGIPEVVRKMTYLSQGLILVTGKINTGKTTTLNALINDINENQNKKILTLEKPIEYKHKSKKSLIVQKEVGRGRDILNYSDGVKNSLREDCDILIIGEIRDKQTMEAAIEMAESGHLVIGTLHTKSCAETIERIVNLYEIREQPTVKYMISTLLKLVLSQRLIPTPEGDKLVLIPEVMVVDKVISGILRKEKINISEIEDAIQSGSTNGSIGLINSLAELFVEGKITLDQAKSQVEEKNIEILNRTITQLRIRKQIQN